MAFVVALEHDRLSRVGSMQIREHVVALYISSGKRIVIAGEIQTKIAVDINAHAPVGQEAQIRILINNARKSRCQGNRLAHFDIDLPGEPNLLYRSLGIGI